MHTKSPSDVAPSGSSLPTKAPTDEFSVPYSVITATSPIRGPTPSSSSTSLTLSSPHAWVN